MRVRLRRRTGWLAPRRRRVALAVVASLCVGGLVHVVWSRLVPTIHALATLAVHLQAPPPRLPVAKDDNLVWSAEAEGWVPGPPAHASDAFNDITSTPKLDVVVGPSYLPRLGADEDVATLLQRRLVGTPAPARPHDDATTITKRKLTAVVYGEPKMIARDFPILKAGYESTGLFAEIVHTPSRRQIPLGIFATGTHADVVLCFSLKPCASDEEYRLLIVDNPFMRVNRLPGLRDVLWSKQNFCAMVPKDVARLVSFACYVLPQEWDAFAEQSGNATWIAKPWASGGGNGITIASGWDDVQRWRGSKLVVQPLLATPLLLDGVKIDLRTFALVTNMVPLRAYLHSQGLVRLAGAPFAAALGRRGGERSQFLTNVSVNKKAYGGDASLATHPLEFLWERVGAASARVLRLGMDRAVGLLLLSVENVFGAKHDVGSADGQLYALLGVDVIIDATDLSMRIIEVNGEPSFEASNGTRAHYTDSKVAVQRDAAALVFAAGPLRKQRDYVQALASERAAASGFRPVYPSPLCALSRANNALFESVLDSSRLALHRELHALERDRVAACLASPCPAGFAAVVNDVLSRHAV